MTRLSESRITRIRQLMEKYQCKTFRELLYRSGELHLLKRTQKDIRILIERYERETGGFLNERTV